MKKLLLVIGILISFCALAQNKAIPDPPNPPRLVNDFANLLPDFQEAELERKLAAYDDSTSNQIAVVIVNDLGGMDASQFATELGQKWGVGGQAQFDNGIVVLISTEPLPVPPRRMLSGHAALPSSSRNPERRSS